MKSIKYIKFLFGDEIFQKVNDLKSGDSFIETDVINKNEKYEINANQIHMSKDNDEIQCQVEKLNIQFTEAADSETVKKIGNLLFSPDDINMNVKQLSIHTDEGKTKNEPKMNLNFQSEVKVNHIYRYSCPAGKAFPSSDDEWSVVFGCPFFHTFPPAKSLPCVLLEGSVQVTIPNHKQTTYYTILLPSYIIFYDSIKSNKASDSILLIDAMIEAETKLVFSVTKSGQKTIFSFSKAEEMEKWLHQIHSAILSCNAALDTWRRENA